jgi:hypothetical protein
MRHDGCGGLARYRRERSYETGPAELGCGMGESGYGRQCS